MTNPIYRRILRLLRIFFSADTTRLVTDAVPLVSTTLWLLGIILWRDMRNRIRKSTRNTMVYSCVMNEMKLFPVVSRSSLVAVTAFARSSENSGMDDETKSSAFSQNPENKDTYIKKSDYHF